jgi:predicted TIM-barrel fold metal-dependent hydrolase
LSRFQSPQVARRWREYSEKTLEKPLKTLDNTPTGKKKEAGHNSGLSTRTTRKSLRPLQMRHADKRLKHTQNTAFASQQRKYHNRIWIPGLSPFLVTYDHRDYALPVCRNMQKPNVCAVEMRVFWPFLRVAKKEGKAEDFIREF